MATAVIGTFDDGRIADKVKAELIRAGLSEREIDVLDGNEDRLVAEIVAKGFAEQDARSLAEARRSGKILLAALTSDERKADEAAAIMDRFEAGNGNGHARDHEANETVGRVEEELEVGKRRVLRGGVRVTSNVVEQPVEETVRLREEHVDVDRRRVDRELSPEEAKAAFKDRTIEMTETKEELEVGKKARLVEEVTLKKGAEEREEKVRDTVRRTEVEVEKIEPGKRQGR